MKIVVEQKKSTFTVRVTVSPTTSLSIAAFTLMTPSFEIVNRSPGGEESVKQWEENKNLSYSLSANIF